MITLATLFVFALSQPLPIEEVEMAFTEGVSADTQNFLLSDAFAQLDLDGNGLLTKAERKPMLWQLFRPIAEAYVTAENPDVVTKEAFVQRFLVPDFGGISNPSQQDCDNEAAFVGMSGEDFWTFMMGSGVESVSVQQCAEAWYEVIEDEDDITASEFISRFLEGSHPQPTEDIVSHFTDAEGNMHVQQIDTYTTMHNSQCEMTEGRRQLVNLPLAGAVNAKVMTWLVFTTVVGAAVQCTGPVVFRQWFPQFAGKDKPVSDDECTLWKFSQDMISGFGAGYSALILRQAYKALAMYLGWQHNHVPRTFRVDNMNRMNHEFRGFRGVVPSFTFPNEPVEYENGQMGNTVANTIGRTMAQDGLTPEETIAQMEAYITGSSAASQPIALADPVPRSSTLPNPIVGVDPRHDLEGGNHELRLANNPFHHSYSGDLRRLWLPHPLERPDNWCGPSHLCRRRYLREVMAQYAQDSNSASETVQRKL